MYLMNVVFCQVDVFAQRSPKECGVSESGREAPLGEAMTPNRIEGPHKNSVYVLRANDIKHLRWL